MQNLRNLCGKFIKKHTIYFFLIISLIVISAICSLLMPQLSMKLMDNGLLTQNFSYILKICAIMLCIITIDQISTILSTVFMSRINLKIKKSLVIKCMHKLQKIYYEIFDQKSSVRIVHELDTDIGVVSSLIDRDTWTIIIQAIKFIGSMAGLILIDYRMTLIICVYIPVKFLFSFFMIKNRKKLYKKYLSTNSSFQGFLGEIVAGITDINIFDTVERNQQKAERDINDLNHNEFRFTLYDRINSSSERILMQIIICSIYVLGANFVFNNDLSIGALFAFVSYSANVLSPFSFMINVAYGILSKKPSIDRLTDFLNLPERSLSDTLLGEFSDINFRNVSFTYNGSTLPAINNVSFHIKQGEKIAIVGANGCGKSTILSLLLKCYPYSNGEITINSLSLSSIDNYSLFRQISYAGTYSYVFNDTIKNNICYDSVSDMNKLKQVQKYCQADFINDFPDQFDTIISANATTLSAGQKQKIILMRALYKDSDLLILDEATSHMDKLSEETFFMQYILSSKRTILFVTHNLELLSYADKVLFMENGSISGYSSHQTLMETNENYRMYVINQADTEKNCDDES